jgi:hypothetical protein
VIILLLLSLDYHVLCFVLCHYFGSYHAIVGEKLKAKEKGWWTVTQNVGNTIFLRVISKYSKEKPLIYRSFND